MKSIGFLVAFVLLGALFSVSAKAEISYVVAKQGSSQTMVVGKKVVTISTDNFFHCGSYKISDLQTAAVEANGPISDSLGTSMSFSGFDGASIIMSCVCSDNQCSASLAELRVSTK